SSSGRGDRIGRTDEVKKVSGAPCCSLMRHCFLSPFHSPSERLEIGAQSRGTASGAPVRQAPRGEIQVRLRIVIIGVLAGLLAPAAQGSDFRTHNPLQAFLQEEYPLGDDYFIHGNTDMYLFRCALTKKRDKLEGIVLSEISIWGNHGGPW